MFMGGRLIEQTITPTLLFVGDQCGRAKEAIETVGPSTPPQGTRKVLELLHIQLRLRRSAIPSKSRKRQARYMMISPLAFTEGHANGAPSLVGRGFG